MSRDAGFPTGSVGTGGTDGTVGTYGAVDVSNREESVYAEPKSSTDKELLDFALGSEVAPKSSHKKKSSEGQSRSKSTKDSKDSKDSKNPSKEDKSLKSSKVSGCSPKTSSSSKTSSGESEEESSSSSCSDDILSNDDFDGFWVQVFIVAIVLTIIVVLLQLPAFENWLSCYMTCYEYRLGVRALLFFVFALVILAAFIWFFRC